MKNDLHQQVNEYEMLDFILSRMSGFVKRSNRKVNVLSAEEEAEFKDKEVEEQEEALPEKIDDLLDHINQHYFQGGLNLHNKEWIKQTLKVKRKAKIQQS